jgi:hypothetical protein
VPPRQRVPRSQKCPDLTPRLESRPILLQPQRGATAIAWVGAPAQAQDPDPIHIHSFPLSRPLRRMGEGWGEGPLSLVQSPAVQSQERASYPRPWTLDLGLAEGLGLPPVPSRPAIGRRVTNFVSHLSENKFVTHPPCFPLVHSGAPPSARKESVLSIQSQKRDPSKISFLGIWN